MGVPSLFVNDSRTHVYEKKMGLLLYVGNLLSDSGRSLDDGFRYRCCLLFLFFVSRRCWRLGVFRALSVWETEGACIARKQHTYCSLHLSLSPCLMTFCIQTPFPLAPEPHSILGEKHSKHPSLFVPLCLNVFTSTTRPCMRYILSRASLSRSNEQRKQNKFPFGHSGVHTNNH